jgi:hypothetical protein
MKRTTAAVYYEHGGPLCYSLFCEGQEVAPKPVRGIHPMMTTFDQAYRLFEVIRLHFRADGTPVEGLGKKQTRKLSAQTFLNGLLVPQLALPHNKHTPSQSRQLRVHFPVPFHVPFEFGGPERSVGLRDSRTFAFGVLVEEARMNEYHRIVFRQRHVRLAWQILPMQPEPEAQTVQNRTHSTLRLRVLRAHCCHVPSPLLWCVDIHVFRLYFPGALA